MKKDKVTGAIICGKCGAEFKVKQVSRINGYPSKIIFRCPTKILNASNQLVACGGGSMVQKEAVKKLSKKTLEYYNLIRKK